MSGIKPSEILGEAQLTEILKWKAGYRNAPKLTLPSRWQLEENSGDNNPKLLLIWTVMEGFKKPGSSKVGRLKKQA